MEDVFKKRLTEWASRSWNQGVYCFSHFLSLAELSDFHALRPALAPAAWALFGGAEGVALSTIRLAARLVMDEEGVTATAFTEMAWGAGGPQDQLHGRSGPLAALLIAHAPSSSFRQSG